MDERPPSDERRTNESAESFRQTLEKLGFALLESQLRDPERTDAWFKHYLQRLRRRRRRRERALRAASAAAADAHETNAPTADRGERSPEEDQAQPPREASNAVEAMREGEVPEHAPKTSRAAELAGESGDNRSDPSSRSSNASPASLPDRSTQLDRIGFALSSAVRRRILDALGDFSPCPHQTLARAVGRDGHTTRKHLRILERAGLVETRRDGRECYCHFQRHALVEFYGAWLKKHVRKRKLPDDIPARPRKRRR